MWALFFPTGNAAWSSGCFSSCPAPFGQLNEGKAQLNINKQHGGQPLKYKWSMFRSFHHRKILESTKSKFKSHLNTTPGEYRYSSSVLTILSRDDSARLFIHLVKRCPSRAKNVSGAVWQPLHLVTGCNTGFNTPDFSSPFARANHLLSKSWNSGDMLPDSGFW